MLPIWKNGVNWGFQKFLSFTALWKISSTNFHDAMLQLRPLETPSAANGVASNGVGVSTNGHGNGAVKTNGHANGASHASHGGPAMWAGSSFEPWLEEGLFTDSFDNYRCKYIIFV